MSEMDLKEARKILEQQWESQGDCHSCGWHGALFEHQVDDWEIENAIKYNRGVLELECRNKDDENRDLHRGVIIYLLPEIPRE